MPKTHPECMPDYMALGASSPQDAKRIMIDRFVTALFTGYTSGYIEMRCFKKAEGSDYRPVQVYWFKIGGEADLNSATIAEAAFRADAEGFDVYIGVLPRREKGNGKKSSVVTARWLWVDHDFKIAPPDDCLAAICRAGCDMIVETGNGYHGYIRLLTPVVLTPSSVAAFESKLRSWQLSVHRKCDNTADAPRILRLPGTTNWKDRNNPKPVRLLLTEDLHAH